MRAVIVCECVCVRACFRTFISFLLSAEFVLFKTEDDFVASNGKRFGGTGACKKIFRTGWTFNWNMQFMFDLCIITNANTTIYKMCIAHATNFPTLERVRATVFSPPHGIDEIIIMKTKTILSFLHHPSTIQFSIILPKTARKQQQQRTNPPQTENT